MLRYVLRASLAIVLMFAVGTLTAVAQYPGGGGGMGGGSSPTYTPHGSYSNKGAIKRLRRTGSSGLRRL